MISMAERDSDRLLDAIVRPVEGAEVAGERIEPGAEAAHRDDLAREAARLWFGMSRGTIPAEPLPMVPTELGQLLDRLADAYGYRG
jgi:hypothetical protein